MSKKKHRKPTGGNAPEAPRGELRGILDDSPEDTGTTEVAEVTEAETTETEVDDAVGGASPTGTSRAVNLFFDAYELLTYTLGLGLTSSMIVARTGGDATLQWIVGIIAMLATILSRTVFAGDLSDIYSEAKQQVDENRARDMEELRSGNYDGVPKSIVQMLKYPTAEDYERVREEAELQRKLLRDFQEARRNRKGRNDGEPR